MKRSRVKIIIERLPENVWLATSKELPGFTVEIEDGVEIYDIARKLALEFMEIDGERRKGEPVIFEFEERC